MAVSLFTVRAVLTALGTEDFGIYNVVGSIATTFTFLSSTMASASQRFFAFELGKKNYEQLKKVFSISIIIYIFISIIIFILAETIGLWFLNTQLNLPISKIESANWIYQFSIFSFMMILITTPYNAAIIAREKMNVYAYVSILEVILKLIIVYILLIFSTDKLKLYAVLTFLVTSITTLVYRTYCSRNFKECNVKFKWDKEIFRTLLSYSGWNLFGTLTSVSFDQGINFLLNIFFGPMVSASRAIAYQVNNAIASFSTNFYAAVRPQIIKSYAEKNEYFMMKLVFRSSNYSFYLLLILSIPVLLETRFILTLWLNDVPLKTIEFVQLSIIFSLVNSLQIPITTAVQATGSIKKYQMVVGSIMLLCLPISFILLKIGYPAEYCYYTMISVSLVALLFRLKILKTLIRFSYRKYIEEVILKICLVTTLSYLTPLIVTLFLSESWLRLASITLTDIAFTSLIIFLIGIGSEERAYIVGVSKKIISNFKLHAI